MTKKEKIESLNILRAIAFLEVFLSHAISSKFELGGSGVSLFIILSGFLMYYTYADKEFICGIKDHINFAWSKLKRLYILHIITATFLFIVFLNSYILNDRFGEICNHIVAYICNIFLIQTWIPDARIYYSLNAVSWYLSDCMFFYICFPLIIKLIRGFIHSVRHAVVCMLGLLCLQMMIRALFGFSTIENVDAWLYRLPAFRIFEFMIGCLCGYVYITKDKLTCNKTLMSLIQILIIPLGFSVNLIIKNNIVHNVILTICSMVAVWSWTIDGYASNFLGTKIIYKIADLSKYAFLIHQIVIADVGVFLGWFFDSSINIMILISLVAFVVTMMLSVIYGYMIDSENIFNRLLKQGKSYFK